MDSSCPKMVCIPVLIRRLRSTTNRPGIIRKAVMLAATPAHKWLPEPAGLAIRLKGDRQIRVSRSTRPRRRELNLHLPPQARNRVTTVAGRVLSEADIKLPVA